MSDFPASELEEVWEGDCRKDTNMKAESQGPSSECILDVVNFFKEQHD